MFQLDKLSYRVSAHCPNCQAVTSFDDKHTVIAGGPMVLNDIDVNVTNGSRRSWTSMMR
jgi:hypothetical protein